MVYFRKKKKMKIFIFDFVSPPFRLFLGNNRFASEELCEKADRIPHVIECVKIEDVYGLKDPWDKKPRPVLIDMWNETIYSGDDCIAKVDSLVRLLKPVPKKFHGHELCKGHWLVNLGIDKNAIERWFSADGKRIDLRDHVGRQPLHHAAWRGDADMIDCLIRKLGACVDTVDSMGQTPLHYATVMGFTNAARVLIKYGANIRAINNRGEEPIHLVAQRGHVQTARMLRDLHVSDDTTYYQSGHQQAYEYDQFPCQEWCIYQ